MASATKKLCFVIVMLKSILGQFSENYALSIFALLAVEYFAYQLKGIDAL